MQALTLEGKKSNSRNQLVGPDRLPPQSLEAEVNVLGAILLDNEALHDVVPILEVEDFYRDSHQVIYGEMRRLYTEGKPVDPEILTEALKRAGKFERIGGDDTLFRIVGAVPHSANAAYHAQIVRDKAITRRAVQVYHNGLKAAYSNTMSADQLLEATIGDIIAIMNRQGNTNAIPLSVAIDRTLERIRNRKEGMKDGAETGFYDLDGLIGGCLPNGSLILIGARPSMGKTAFGMNINEFFAGELEEPSLFISMEMGQLEVTERMLAGESGIGGQMLKTPWSKLMDWKALTEAANRLRDKPFHLIDQAGLTLAKIHAIARREKARLGIKLLTIDYAQLIAGTGDDDSRRSEQEIGARISRGLKGLARDLNIPVIVLSQLNRKAEERADHRPNMADIRGTGGWEQDADQILFLYRPEYYNPLDQPGVAEVIVAKNRNGRTGPVKLSFDKDLTKFGSLAGANIGEPPPAHTNGKPF
jgi:replicative DNA helicase